MSPKLLEYNLTRLIIIGGFFIVGLFGAKLIAATYYQKMFYQFSEPTRAMEVDFREQIEAEKDPYKLCTLGNSFLKSEKTDLALLSFQKATTLDPKYRDAWTLRGYAELKTNQPQEAVNSLKKAESIDPIYPRTYELLAIAYTQTGDGDAAKKAEEKYQYLTKTN